MKSHSWESAAPPHEEGRAEAPRRVHRGTGQRDADQVDRGERQTDGQAVEAHDGHLVGHGQHDEDVDEGQHQLHQERAAEVDVHGRAAVVSVTAEQTVGLDSRHLLGEQEEQCGADDGAEELRDPVLHRPAQTDAPGQQHAQRHGRVDVAARDRAERVGQRQHGEAECERDAEGTDVLAGEHHGSHRDEHQQQSSQELRGNPPCLRRLHSSHLTKIVGFLRNYSSEGPGLPLGAPVPRVSVRRAAGSEPVPRRAAGPGRAPVPAGP